jgi:hypothetical protein
MMGAFDRSWCQSTERLSTMDFMNLEVDGSLANPFAVGAVALWTAILSGIAVFLVRRVRTSGRAIANGALFCVAILATPGAQVAIGSYLYWTNDHRMASVGFWGGPPIWIAPVVSCGIGSLACAYFWHRRSQIRNDG